MITMSVPGLRWLPAALLALPCWLINGGAAAHSPGESFLELRPETGDGTWEIALRDLDEALLLDSDGDGAITARELRVAAPRIRTHALYRLALRTSAGSCAPDSDSLALTNHGATAYAALGLRLGCPDAAHAAFVEVDYGLLFDRDRLHRGLIQVAGTVEQTGIARPDRRRLRFTPAGSQAAESPAAAVRTLYRYSGEGILHIWQGLDHVLFLLVLLLPSVLTRREGRWQPVPGLRGALADVLKVVTAFTVAHSLTLSLAALGLLQVSARIIEPAIAASVVLAAANNLWAIFGRDRWAVAFALGLLHGFGFSSVLAELGLPRAHLLAALGGFNLGVELGQLALVALFVPLAFFLRDTTGYRRLGLTAGSALAGAVAIGWLVERIFDLSFLPTFLG